MCSSRPRPHSTLLDSEQVRHVVELIKPDFAADQTDVIAGLGITVAGAAFCLVYVALLWWHNQKLGRKRAESGGEDDQREYRYQY